jgi:hypothetical protein
MIPEQKEKGQRQYHKRKTSFSRFWLREVITADVNVSQPIDACELGS